MTGWRTSSRSGGTNCVQVWMRSARCESGHCVEVAFRKASASAGQGNCVEVGFTKASASQTSSQTQMPTSTQAPLVLVRDSKDPVGPVLKFSSAAWAAFLAGIKAGEFEYGGAP